VEAALAHVVKHKTEAAYFRLVAANGDTPAGQTRDETRCRVAFTGGRITGEWSRRARPSCMGGASPPGARVLCFRGVSVQATMQRFSTVDHMANDTPWERRGCSG